MDAIESTLSKEMVVIEKARNELEISILKHAKIISDMKYKLNQLIPIAILPPEVLTEVFVNFAVPQSEISRYYGFKPYTWLRILHVCRHWRDIALSSPRVWSTIFVTGSPCVAEMLSRSKTVPLEVYAGYPVSTTSTRENVHMIFQQIERICRLELYHCPYLTPDDIPATAPLLDTLIIKTVDRNGLDSSDPSLFEAFEACDIPTLRCLEITNPGMRWTSPLLRPTLTTLVFGHSRDAQNVSLTILLNVLDSMPLLQHLDIFNVLPHVNHPDEVANIVQIVTLDRLSELHITDWGLSCARLLGQLSFPRNTTLSFSCELLESHTQTVCRALTSKLAINEDFPNPLVSLALMGQRANTTRLKGWKDFQPVQSHVLPDRIPIPQIDISLRLPAYHKVLKELFDALPLSTVQSLYIHPSQDHPMPEDVWINSFADMRQLQQLSVERWAEDALPEVLLSRIPLFIQPEGRRTQPFFPNLSVLQFEGVRLRDPHAPNDDDLLRRYHKAFKQRKKSHAELPLLVISKCFNFFAEDRHLFDDVVKEMRWDGFQKSDTEYEDEDELGSTTDQWEDEYALMPWGFPGGFAGDFLSSA